MELVQQLETPETIEKVKSYLEQPLHPGDDELKTDALIRV